MPDTSMAMSLKKDFRCIRNNLFLSAPPRLRVILVVEN